MNMIEQDFDPVELAVSSTLYFDIETIPAQDPEIRQMIVDKMSPPKNYKSEDVIAKWRAENEADAIAKTALDGTFGHVCCIAWVKGEEKPNVAIGDEPTVLKSFFNAIDPYHSVTLCGHNIAGFDLPFLQKRAIILGVKLPARANFPRNPKPWDKTIADTMQMWDGKNFAGLDKLCRVLGIPGKEGFDGSMVAAAWEAGQHDLIAEYCQDDVRRVRAIHKRFLVAGV